LPHSEIIHKHFFKKSIKKYGDEVCSSWAIETYLAVGGRASVRQPTPV
jgi:hypothetical protein